MIWAWTQAVTERRRTSAREVGRAVASTFMLIFRFLVFMPMNEEFYTSIKEQFIL
jgi:hypothetical protein